MEYLQHPEILALLKASYEYGNREAHLALLTMYATGARISQIVGDRHAKRPIEGLKGVDIIRDAETGGHRIRILAAKRGKTRTFRVLCSPNPVLDMRDLVDLAKQRGTSYLFGGLTRHYMHAAHSDPAAAYTYVQENDGKLADAAMASVFAGA